MHVLKLFSIQLFFEFTFTKKKYLNTKSLLVTEKIVCIRFRRDNIETTKKKLWCSDNFVARFKFLPAKLE